MKNILYSAFTIMILLFIQCQIDHGLEPVRSGIQGKITFTGEWPVQPGEVRLVSATQFPPADINDLILGEPIPTNVSSYSYSFYLKPRNYKIVGAAWRELEAAWEFSSICGLYFEGSDSLMPGEIVIPSDTSIVRGINFSVDRSKIRRTDQSRIVGTIQFDGVWPASFTNAIVVASPRDPISESISLLDLSYSSVIPRGAQSFEYTINAYPATYQAIGVLFFKGDQPLTVDDLYYSQNVGGLVIGEVTVAENETVSGPDFNIQLESVQSGIQGNVTFTGAWPAIAEEVRLIAATTFPPNFEEVIIGESIPVDAASYDYFFALRPDTYRIVGVAWRAEGTNWDILSICGFYFVEEDSLAPGQVVVPTDVSVVDNINIEVNRSKARKITDTKIVGSITFNGTWPADITEARVIATTRFSIIPLEMPTLLDLAFSDVIQPGLTSLDYVIKAFPGTFVATGVIFFREGQTLSVNDIFYSAEVGGLDVNPYEVPEDSTVTGPDFNIQF
jgi:hypothetical protein